MEASVKPTELESVVIRFAGDSGDGMQLTGSQFTQATSIMGNDLATFPDYPAEIRAPAGTTYGVSGFQIHFADHDILTPGDKPDVLVAMNPAALKVNLDHLDRGALIVLNTGAFNKLGLKKAGYEVNPLEDGTLDPFRTLQLDITKMTLAAVKEHGLSTKEAQRCKNMWTLGLMFWLFNRDKEATVKWLEQKFKKRADVAGANIAALNAGHAFGETAEMPEGVGRYQVPRAELQPGEYRNVDGNQAVAWGLVAGARLAGLPLMYGSYPITPASNLLHHLAKLKHFGVTTFQAEDEIAAVCSAVGAAFGGALGVTGTSGPGVALKGEAIGLALVTELPLIIVDIQRGGPSTGLPTKTEQSDLLMAVYGRNGDAPMPVLAACSPGDCFYLGVEAVRIATKYMTPVMLLTDGYLANGAEPWKIPSISDLKPFPVTFASDTEGFHPYKRDEATLARNWAIPGTPDLMHRIGGLEKNFESGHISYDPANHQKMTKVRADKVANIAADVPPAKLSLGDENGGDVLVVGWGSTFGAIHQAVSRAIDDGLKVGHLHLRYLNPLPRGLDKILRSYDRIIVPEMNNGMLVKLLRAEFLIPAQPVSKIAGQPFTIAELSQAIRQKGEA